MFYKLLKMYVYIINHNIIVNTIMFDENNLSLKKILCDITL